MKCLLENSNFVNLTFEFGMSNNLSSPTEYMQYKHKHEMIAIKVVCIILVKVAAKHHCRNESSNCHKLLINTFVNTIDTIRKDMI